MTHTVDEANWVITRGEEGQVVAAVVWPTNDAAVSYARRIAETCGGTVIVKAGL